MHDTPHPTDIRRFTLLATTGDKSNGKQIGMGVEFPGDSVTVISLYNGNGGVYAYSTTDGAVEFIRTAVIGPDDHGNDLWVEYEDTDTAD